MAAKAASAPRRFVLVCVLLFAAEGLAAEPEGLSLYLAGRYEDARAAALEVTRVEPSNTEAYLVLCWSLLGLERWADAENYASKAYAIRRDPRFLEVLGETAYRLGRNEAALKHFQAYVSAIPEGTRAGTAYYYMGEIYLRLARYAHADMAFTAALGFIPDNPRWWARLGYARERAGELSSALSAYTEALRLDPRLEDARLGKERIASRVR